MFQTEVLVVGAGLAGLSVATFLGLHGVAPLLVERHEGTSNQPKARGQFPHTMEALRIAGLDEEFVAASPVGGFPIRIAASVAGPVFTEISGTDGFPDLTDVTTCPWADVSQERAEQILLRRARELGAQVRFGIELASLTQDEEGVTALLRDRASGAEQTVRARYLVAADGHTSPVREALGINRHGHGVLGTATGTIFDADLGDLIDGAGALYHLHNPDLPGHGGAFVTTDTPNRYVLNVGLDEHGEPPSPQRWIELIRIATGRPDLEPKLAITHERSFVTKHQIADRFSQGRVHLIGDAARVMPPTGGAGGNTAILDGFYLAWKLAMVLHGEAGPRLLDSHDPERRPYSDLIADQQYANLLVRTGQDASAAQRLIEPVSALFFGYRHRSDAVLTEPDDDGALWEDPSRPSGRPGMRAAHVRLRHNGVVGSTRDLFGWSFVLLTASAGQDWARAADRVGRELGLPCPAHVIGEQAVDGDFLTRYGIGESGAVLVRPDGFVAWRATGAARTDAGAELDAVLRQVLDR